MPAVSGILNMSINIFNTEFIVSVECFRTLIGSSTRFKEKTTKNLYFSFSFYISSHLKLPSRLSKSKIFSVNTLAVGKFCMASTTTFCEKSVNCKLNAKINAITISTKISGLLPSTISKRNEAKCTPR